MNRTELNVSS